MKLNACFSFLDLEAGHSGHDRDCDNTNVHDSQASLVDFVDDKVSSGNDLEDDMTGIYLTSLMPISQQPEGFGFYVMNLPSLSVFLPLIVNRAPHNVPVTCCPCRDSFLHSS